MVKAKAKYRYIKRGEVIPRDAKWRGAFGWRKKWVPYYTDWFLWKENKNIHNWFFSDDEIRVEVKPRRKA